MFRSSAPGASGLAVQDANILKIRVVYGYKMVVPVIDKIVLGAFRAAHYSGMSANEILMLESGELPIVAQAVVRMQTPIRDRDLLASADGPGGGDGDNPPGWGGSGGNDPPGWGGSGGNDPPPGDGDGGDGPPLYCPLPPRPPLYPTP